MRRRDLLCLLPVATVAAPGRRAGAQAAYPTRPITLVVPWAAGGGTDATARVIARLMEPELGVPVNVVNRVGAGGVIGHAAIAAAPPDGYTLGILTAAITLLHWQGLTNLDHRAFTPLALYNENPAGLQVRASSPYEDAAALLAAIRRLPPGSLVASGAGQAGSWHIALAGLLRAAGMAPDRVRWIPSQGAAQALQELVAGGVDLVTCAVAEARPLLEADLVRSLATMGEARNPAFPHVPTLAEATGLDWRCSDWRGVAGPEGLPPEVTRRLVEVLARVHASPEFQRFMSEQGFGLAWRGPDEFAAYMAASDQAMGEVLRELGLAG